MGLMAEAMMEYAEPLLERADGSQEYMEKAVTLAQTCWNLALLPETERETFLEQMRPTLGMDEEEFQEFKEDVIEPMINRHHEMFPGLSLADKEASLTPTRRKEEKYPGVGRNQPCPCGSGKKYKRCCGKQQ